MRPLSRAAVANPAERCPPAGFQQGRVRETPVLIVGAGPVGLTLAIDLAQRGVPATLIERNAQASALPKMERCNARTMEIFRRMGIAERVRAAGLPRSAPMDVFLADAMSAAEPLVRLACPSVAQAQAQIAAHNDGGPLEPYQLISQYTLEPLLRSIAESYPALTVRFGCELTSFEQDPHGVTAVLRGPAGAETLRARYLAGCDGGSSTVRKQLGIVLAGRGRIRTLRQALFFAPDLYERIPMGKGRHYHIAAPPIFPFIIIQDSTRHWTLHAAAESDERMPEIFRAALGMDVAFETRSVNAWTQHLLCADAYAAGRVFIAGDAAHLVIPTGGLGMNTGIGDAIDLGWKLAATLAGWGGPELLASYAAERRPIGLRNVRASEAAMSGRLTWRAAETRAAMARAFDREQRKVTEILGIEAGYRYVDSPIVAEERGAGPDPEDPQYVPTTWPGFRLPHVWLPDGTALADRIGPGYTILRVGSDPPESAPLARALRATGAPVDELHVRSVRARELYARDLVLVRPDLHVAWRGNALPADPHALALRVTGNARRAPEARA
jgi:2-polyprenyl-6-methoxyphenol hydroxylase-like FAD-dependent oxidoreductase